jgi:hypothetical protein
MGFRCMKKNNKNETINGHDLFDLRNGLEQLNNLEEGEETENLKEILSENLLKCGIRVFRIMSAIDKLKPIKRDQIRRAAKILDYSFKPFSSMLAASSNTEILRRIKLGDLFDYSEQENEPLFEIHRLTEDEVDRLKATGKNFLAKKIRNERQACDVYLPCDEKKIKRACRELDITTTNLMEIVGTDPSRVVDVNQNGTQGNILKIHGHMDNPLNILVYFFRHHLRRIKSKSINGRILKFIQEQGIIDSGKLEESSISKKASNERAALYEYVYNNYHSVFWALNTYKFLNLEAAIQKAKDQRQISFDDTKNYYDLIFPTWSQFIFINLSTVQND